MLSFIAKLILKSKIRTNEQNLQRRFLSWEKIEKIALVISSDSPLNKSEVDRWISDSNKYVEVFYIETKSKMASFGDWTCFSKKDITILKLPTRNVESTLKNKNYDLVINSCFSDDLFSAAIVSGLSSPFKCASMRGFCDEDLIIRTANKNNTKEFLNDVLHYLRMIRA